MNESSKTPLIITLVVVVLLFLFFGGGAMTGSMMSGGMMGRVRCKSFPFSQKSGKGAMFAALLSSQSDADEYYANNRDSNWNNPVGWCGVDRSEDI
jgi:hypothetical protein